MSCEDGTNSTPKPINRRHSIDFAFDLQNQKPIINSKSEGRDHSQIEPFILSFSDLLEKPTTTTTTTEATTNNNKRSCLNTELVLDNLFANNTLINEPIVETNKFNTDFYKLCSDSFNESNYGITSQQQNQQSLSLDRFQVSYQL